MRKGHKKFDLEAIIPLLNQDTGKSSGGLGGFARKRKNSNTEKRRRRLVGKKGVTSGLKL